MKILVTGGAGFIGSHIVDRYIAAGHDVLVLDNFSAGKLDNINGNAELERLDLCEFDRVDALLASYRPDLISHHAAQIDVRKSVADPVFDAQVNVLSSVNLLDAAARHGVRGIIFASSGGTVYGETPQPATETSAKAPVSPYGAAKHSVEGYLFSFSATGRLPGITLRYGNVYGPRQDPAGEAGVISIFAGSLLQGGRPTIFGDGTAVRDYIMVADVVRANELAIEHLLTRTNTPATVDDAAFNIGTGVSTSVNELYDLIVSCSGGEQSAEHVAPRAGELQESRLDITKAGKVLQFDPQILLREGIGETLAWIAAHDTDAKR
ncbi:NAD-dependent epimerase/dehydratase family protein [Candidatus Bipolaricaulota bacterium]